MKEAVKNIINQLEPDDMLSIHYFRNLRLM